MRVIIDRFEEDKVVLEYEGQTYILPRAVLSAGAKEGDVLMLAATPDPAATEERRQRVERLLQNLFDD